MADLTEQQARRSEIELMIGRLSALSRHGSLSSSERIGACKALQVLEHRRDELSARAVPAVPVDEENDHA